MSENTLATLFTEIEARLQQRLQQIDAEGQSRLEQMEQEQKRLLEEEIRKQTQVNTALLQRLRSRAERELEVEQQRRIWAFQASCVRNLLVQAREVLQKRTLAQKQLNAFVKEAKARLGNPGHLVVKLKADDAARLKTKDIRIQQAPLLGGAVAVDMQRGIEIDGSWEQRLEALEPQLWQQWHQHVCNDHED